MKIKLTLNKDGQFKVDHVDQLSYVYFPLTNFKSLKSSITPRLGGDAKIDQNHFLLAPTTNEDFHNSFLNRNVYLRVNDSFTWSITGNTPYQMLHPDNVTLEGDFLIHTLTRSHAQFSANVESFVPLNDQFTELHKVVITNTTEKPLQIKPVVSVPLYSRSADNIRDHRHVSALLNHAKVYENVIINQPTFSFDERGHVENHMHYGVFVYESHQRKPRLYWPVLEDFIGEGGQLLDPYAVRENSKDGYQPGTEVTGYEITGGFEYKPVELSAGQSFTCVIGIMAAKDEKDILDASKAMTLDTYNRLKKQTKEGWASALDTLQFGFGDDRLNGWLKWVTLQPILRRIYGCSFLPHHDYGRGGRGWRDLWQDSLALILMDPDHVRHLLFNNFLGVRIDGSNATIIGDEPGVFLADRNHIPRVWMDHGAWPYLTTKLYLDRTNDIRFLFEKQGYFQDQFSHYTKQVNPSYDEVKTLLHTASNKPYEGTILEHLIIQNLIPFFNVGDHQNIRIEDADWNDALDMASNKGESVAFTSLYGQNLVSLGELLLALKNDVEELELLEELDLLLEAKEISSPAKKRGLLKTYFDAVAHGVSGHTKTYKLEPLAHYLIRQGESLLTHIRTDEWMSKGDLGWFNGYYDGDGYRLENVEKHWMTLTGQVFAIRSGAATDDQIHTIIKSADRLLFDEHIGGYRLNTDFKTLKMNMGRMFGFAYGHKENGAMFSHMAVMYAYALYHRGFAKAGHKVLDTIYRHCVDIEHSKIYPGIPEYIDPKGRGMYHYLTGSASWFILTEVTEVFGIKADLGRVVFDPQLMASQFDANNRAAIKTIVHGQPRHIVYHNPDRLDAGDYMVSRVTIEGLDQAFVPVSNGARLDRPITGETIEISLVKRH